MKNIFSFLFKRAARPEWFLARSDKNCIEGFEPAFLFKKIIIAFVCVAFVAPLHSVYIRERRFKMPDGKKVDLLSDFHVGDYEACNIDDILAAQEHAITKAFKSLASKGDRKIKVLVEGPMNKPQEFYARLDKLLAMVRPLINSVSSQDKWEAIVSPWLPSR